MYTERPLWSFGLLMASKLLTEPHTPGGGGGNGSGGPPRSQQYLQATWQLVFGELVHKHNYPGSTGRGGGRAEAKWCVTS